MSLKIISYQERMRVMGDNKSHVLIFKRNSERYGIYEKIIFFLEFRSPQIVWKRANHIFSIKKKRAFHMVNMLDTVSSRKEQHKNCEKCTKY